MSIPSGVVCTDRTRTTHGRAGTPALLQHRGLQRRGEPDAEPHVAEQVLQPHGRAVDLVAPGRADVGEHPDRDRPVAALYPAPDDPPVDPDGRAPVAVAV